MGPVKERESTAAQERKSAEETRAPGQPVAIPLCQQCGAELAQTGLTACPTCGAPVPRPAAQAEEQQFKQALLRDATAAPGRDALAESVSHVPPVLAGVTQFYLPLSGTGRPAGAAELLYQPRLLAFAEAVFADRRKNLEFRRQYRRLAVPPPPGQPAAWHAAEVYDGPLAEAAEPGARWADVPESVNTARKLKALERGFADFLQGNAKLIVYVNPALEVTGAAGEDLASFQQRCRAAALQRAESALAELRAKYAPKFRALNADVPADAVVVKQDSWLSGLSFGLFASNPRPGSRLSARDQARLRNLEDEWLAKRKDLAEKWRQAGEEYTELALTPRKADSQVTHFGLAWAPFWRVATPDGWIDLRPAYR
jgi:hypothetical protein